MAQNYLQIDPAKVKSIREKRNMSKSALGRHINLEDKMDKKKSGLKKIKRIENEGQQQVRVETAKRIARALGVTISDLEKINIEVIESIKEGGMPPSREKYKYQITESGIRELETRSAHPNDGWMPYEGIGGLLFGGLRKKKFKGFHSEEELLHAVEEEVQSNFDANNPSPLHKESLENITSILKQAYQEAKPMLIKEFGAGFDPHNFFKNKPKYLRYRNGWVAAHALYGAQYFMIEWPDFHQGDPPKSEEEIEVLKEAVELVERAVTTSPLRESEKIEIGYELNEKIPKLESYGYWFFLGQWREKRDDWNEQKALAFLGRLADSFIKIVIQRKSHVRVWSPEFYEGEDFKVNQNSFTKRGLNLETSELLREIESLKVDVEYLNNNIFAEVEDLESRLQTLKLINDGAQLSTKIKRF